MAWGIVLVLLWAIIVGGPALSGATTVVDCSSIASNRTTSFNAVGPSASFTLESCELQGATVFFVTSPDGGALDIALHNVTLDGGGIQITPETMALPIWNVSIRISGSRISAGARAIAASSNVLAENISVFVEDSTISADTTSTAGAHVVTVEAPNVSHVALRAIRSVLRAVSARGNAYALTVIAGRSDVIDLYCNASSVFASGGSVGASAMGLRNDDGTTISATNVTIVSVCSSVEAQGARSVSSMGLASYITTHTRTVASNFVIRGVNSSVTAVGAIAVTSMGMSSYGTSGSNSRFVASRNLSIYAEFCTVRAVGDASVASLGISDYSTLNSNPTAATNVAIHIESSNITASGRMSVASVGISSYGSSTVTTNVDISGYSSSVSSVGSTSSATSLGISAHNGACDATNFNVRAVQCNISTIGGNAASAIGMSSLGSTISNPTGFSLFAASSNVSSVGENSVASLGMSLYSSQGSSSCAVANFTISVSYSVINAYGNGCSISSMGLASSGFTGNNAINVTNFVIISSFSKVSAYAARHSAASVGLSSYGFGTRSTTGSIHVASFSFSAASSTVSAVASQSVASMGIAAFDSGTSSRCVAADFTAMAISSIVRAVGSFSVASLGMSIYGNQIVSSYTAGNFTIFASHSNVSAVGTGVKSCSVSSMGLSSFGTSTSGSVSASSSIIAEHSNVSATGVFTVASLGINSYASSGSARINAANFSFCSAFSSISAAGTNSVASMGLSSFAFKGSSTSIAANFTVRASFSNIRANGQFVVSCFGLASVKSTYALSSASFLGCGCSFYSSRSLFGASPPLASSNNVRWVVLRSDLHSDGDGCLNFVPQAADPSVLRSVDIWCAVPGTGYKVTGQHFVAPYGSNVSLNGQPLDATGINGTFPFMVSDPSSGPFQGNNSTSCPAIFNVPSFDWLLPRPEAIATPSRTRWISSSGSLSVSQSLLSSSPTEYVPSTSATWQHSESASDPSSLSMSIAPPQRQQPMSASIRTATIGIRPTDADGAESSPSITADVDAPVPTANVTPPVPIANATAVDVAPAAVVAVTATGGAAVALSVGSSGAAAADMQALVVLGLMQCADAGLQELTSKSDRLLVPVRIGSGPLSGVLGNIICVVGVLIIHGTVLRLMKTTKTMEERCALVRFPSLSIKLTALFYQGLVFECFRLALGDSPVGARILAIIVLLLTVGLPAWGAWWTASRSTVKYAYYRHHRRRMRSAARAVFPWGFWIASPQRRALGAALTSFAGRRCIPFVVLPHVTSLCLALVVNTPLSCKAQAGILVGLFAAVALVLLVVRPYRHPVALAIKVVSSLLLATVCAVPFVPSLGDASAAIGLIVTALGVVGAGISIVFSFLERKWQKTEIAAQQDDDDDGTGMSSPMLASNPLAAVPSAA